MSLLPGDKAPWFGAKCYHTDRFVDLCLDELAGSWVLLCFYPLDFDPIAPSELLELERLRPRLNSIGCRIVAVSRDNVLVHAQFARTAPADGGVAGIRFPLMEDPSGRICRAYRMLMPDGGPSFRGCYILNRRGIVRGRIVSDLPVGLDIKEVVRQVTRLAEDETKYNKDSLVTVEHAVDAKILATGGDNFFSNAAIFYMTHVLRQGDYPACRLGRRQSPINLAAKFARLEPSLGPISFFYRPPWLMQLESEKTAAAVAEDGGVPLAVRNTGCYWEVAVPAAWQAAITGGPLGNDKYRLVSLRAHWGRSEHSLDGRYGAGELQLLHINTKYDLAAANCRADGLVMVAVLMEKRTDGRRVNRELEKIREVLPLIQERGQCAVLPVPVDFDKLLPTSPNYYTYPGSKTEPDFLENVTWFVLEEAVGVSPEALAAMKELSYGGASDPKMRINAKPTVEVVAGSRPILLWKKE